MIGRFGGAQPVERHHVNLSGPCQTSYHVVHPSAVSVDCWPRVLFSNHQDSHAEAPYSLNGFPADTNNLTAQPAPQMISEGLVSLIRTESVGDVLVITLDDPARRNALSLDLNAELIAAIDRAESDSSLSAVVITGAGPAFCAGADLSQLGDSRREGLIDIYAGFLRVADCALPTIAAVNGPAVGAGMNLALACDLRIAGASARFDTRFLSLGIHPGGGHTWLMNQIAGLQGTIAMVLFGEVLGADESVAAGLSWAATSDDALFHTAIDLASRCSRGGRELAIRTKATIRSTALMSEHSRAVSEELETQLWSMDQPEFAERLRAMRAKITSRPDSAATDRQ